MENLETETRLDTDSKRISKLYISSGEGQIRQNNED